MIVSEQIMLKNLPYSKKYAQSFLVLFVHKEVAFLIEKYKHVFLIHLISKIHIGTYIPNMKLKRMKFILSPFLKKVNLLKKLFKKFH